MSTLSHAQTQATTPGANRSTWLLAGAGVMILFTVLGVTNPGNFVLLDRLFNHPLAFLTVGFVFLVTSTATARALPGVAKFVLVAAQMLLGPMAFFILSGVSGESSTVPAPQGHAYEAGTEEGTAVIDPIWSISIRQRSGILARSWEIGCLSGDDPANALVSVRWDGPGRMIIQTNGHGRVTVDVSPTTGHPDRIQDPGILGC